ARQSFTVPRRELIRPRAHPVAMQVIQIRRLQPAQPPSERPARWELEADLIIEQVGSTIVSDQAILPLAHVDPLFLLVLPSLELTCPFPSDQVERCPNDLMLYPPRTLAGFALPGWSSPPGQRFAWPSRRCCRSIPKRRTTGSGRATSRPVTTIIHPPSRC